MNGVGSIRRPRRRVDAVAVSHLVAELEDLLQGPAVGVDHDGVGVAVDDLQIHLPDRSQMWNRAKTLWKRFSGRLIFKVELNLAYFQTLNQQIPINPV